MKIVQLKAENIKKLKAIEITPAGNVVKITGPCEAGKSTVLDTITYALGGGDKLPGQPVRQGEEKGQITIDLGDMVVTRSFTADNSYLKIENKIGFKAPSPQALLDKLIGRLTFDPRVFARADAKGQVDMLLKAVDLKIDPDKLTKIAGVKVAVGSPLQMLNDAYKAVFDVRTGVNRQLDAAQKVLSAMPVVAETKPVSVTELVAEKEQLVDVARKNDKKREAAAAQRIITQQISGQVDQVLNDIAELERRLAAKKQELEAGRKQLQETDDKLRQMDTAANALVDPDLTDINTRIQTADDTNKKARQYEERQAKAAEVTGHQAEADKLTDRLKAIMDYKAEIVKNTKFPVAELDFANGGVTYKGLPFDQASSAEKIRVSLAIGMALNPQLRVILIDGGEALDRKQQAIIEEMAAAHDFQVWESIVDDSGTVGIYIEDGEVKAVNG